MKATNGWIKTDYKVQTIFGWAIASMIVCGSIGLLISQGAYLILCLAILLLIPIGAWQVLSGAIYAIDGDRLQQIYLGVVAVYFGIWYLAAIYYSSYFIVMMVIAAIIAVWLNRETMFTRDRAVIDVIPAQHEVNLPISDQLGRTGGANVRPER